MTLTFDFADWKFSLLCFSLILTVVLGFVFGMNFLLDYLKNQNLIDGQREDLPRIMIGMFSQ